MLDEKTKSRRVRAVAIFAAPEETAGVLAKLAPDSSGYAKGARQILTLDMCRGDSSEESVVEEPWSVFLVDRAAE